MKLTVRACATAGTVAPPFLALVLLALTTAEWRFIRRLGWSAVDRSSVQWPSVLLLGPQGFVLSAAFVVAGFLGVAFAAAVIRSMPDVRSRVAGWLIGLLGVAVALEAFRPDGPAAIGEPSWHDKIHNYAYPVIPLAAIGAAALVAVSHRRDDRGRRLAQLSAAAGCLMALGAGLAFADSIAQLGRYLLLGTLFVWLELFALHVRRSTP